MKYTIHGLQQEKLIEYELDNDDALILSVFRDMYASISIESRLIDGERYIWINQNNLISNQIPIVGSRRKILMRIKKLEELGFIKRKTLYKKNNKKGTFSYITPTSKIDSLLEYTICKNDTEGMQNLHRGCAKTAQEGMQKLHSKDSPIKKDSPIIDYIYIHFNSKKIVVSRSKTEKIIKAIDKALKTYSKEEIIKAIDNYSTVIKDTEYYFDTKWGLETFLKQSNGLAHFVDDGEKWINYITYKDKGDKNGFNKSDSRIEGEKSGISGTTAPGWEGITNFDK